MNRDSLRLKWILEHFVLQDGTGKIWSLKEIDQIIIATNFREQNSHTTESINDTLH